MKPFSEDFREHIVSAYEAGGVSLAEVGRRFSVSGKVVGKFVRQKRELGTLAPQVHRRGRKPAIAGEKEIQLRKHLEKYPDATVLERRDALGLKCSEKTLWQTLRKMGWRFKKNRLAQPSKIAPTLP
jgi:transposase